MKQVILTNAWKYAQNPLPAYHSNLKGSLSSLPVKAPQIDESGILPENQFGIQEVDPEKTLAVLRIGYCINDEGLDSWHGSIGRSFAITGEKDESERCLLFVECKLDSHFEIELLAGVSRIAGQIGRPYPPKRDKSTGTILTTTAGINEDGDAILSAIALLAHGETIIFSLRESPRAGLRNEVYTWDGKEIKRKTSDGGLWMLQYMQ